MGIINRFTAAIQGFRTADNAIGDDLKLSREFLRHGGRKAIVGDWSQVLMTDQDLYTGYSFAAINNRATAVAELAMNNLKTDAKQDILDAARNQNDIVTHPYIDFIDSSDDFADYFFWYTVPTYLDLKGVYYLLAVRTVAKTDTSLRVGNIQEFKMLNPYEVRRIRNEKTLEIGGYVEVRDGMIREIPPQMIIEIRRLNPFSRDDPFALSDAIKDSQFTLKQAGDYTRHSLKNNMAAPGIISTDVKLDEIQFKNFVSRVTNQEKGLPLFGDGAGSITWDSMQIDMDKAALDKINEINRSVMFAASGVGKTMMAIEESGTTRETAKVARDNFIRQHGIPLFRWIIDALNQDYKKYYKKEYDKNGYKMFIDSPLGVDRDAEIKDIQIRKDSWDVYNTLVNKGYDSEVAAKYAMGEIGLDELGEPTNEPVSVISSTATTTDTSSAPTEDMSSKDATANQNHDHAHENVEIAKNQFDEQSQGIINTQQAMLQNTIVNIEGRVVNSVINKVTKNQFEDQSDIISREDREAYESELEIVLAAFYGVIIPLYAGKVLSKRASEFNLFSDFKLNSEVRDYIKSNAKKASESHINTILGDLLKTIQVTNTKQVQIEIKTLLEQEAAKLPAAEAEKLLSRKITPSDEIYKLAQKKALEGSGQREIVNALKTEYNDISNNRAKAIARSEVNRAFTTSQFQADRQFIKQNGLETRAYKRLRNRSTNPCAICRMLAARPPIPFEQNFADLGDELTATYEENGKTRVLKQKVNYEVLSCGNIHTNCSCDYILEIRSE